MGGLPARACTPLEASLVPRLQMSPFSAAFLLGGVHSAAGRTALPHRSSSSSCSSSSSRPQAGSRLPAPPAGRRSLPVAAAAAPGGDAGQPSGGTASTRVGTPLGTGNWSDGESIKPAPANGGGASAASAAPLVPGLQLPRHWEEQLAKAPVGKRRVLQR